MNALPLLGMILVALSMGLSMAHALEFPGKRRLDEDTYRAVQAIYYPGFTIGGLVGEFGALVVLPLVLFFTPLGAERFGWVAAALALHGASHGVYWLVTHPVNSVWVREVRLSGPAALFFSSARGADADWRTLRDVWEYSHVARAVLGLLSLVCLGIALGGWPG